MKPEELLQSSFRNYPPEAAKLTVAHLELLRKLPLAFLPLLLREIIEFDWKFPAERLDVQQQLTYLQALSPEALRTAMSPFRNLRITPELENSNWPAAPAAFSERLSAHLWATHQIDSFRTAAVTYMTEVSRGQTSARLAAHRWTVVVIGQQLKENRYPLFRKLRPAGVYFQNLDPQHGMAALLEAAADRARRYPAPFAHWYLDGDRAEDVHCEYLTCVSYRSLEPVRIALLDKIDRGIRTGAGSEAVRSGLAATEPEDLGVQRPGISATQKRFEMSLLTQGSGTQLFSTTFVQWGAREILRRAQPLSLLTRYAPRQRDLGLKDAFSPVQGTIDLDPQGSLIDADMGAYYTWLNQGRLPGAAESSFLVWFEDHGEALAIGPAFPKGTVSPQKLDLSALLKQMS